MDFSEGAGRLQTDGEQPFMSFRLVLAALVLTVVSTHLAGPPMARAQDAVPESTRATVRADDGTTLAVQVFRPPGVDAGIRTPVAMVIGPYFDDGPPTTPRDRLSLSVQDPDLLGAGYTVVQASLRGFGRSGGCFDFGGRRDQADVRALVEWAADQPWSTGKVGVIGNSYEAWAGVMALAARPRGLAAVVLYSPLISGYRGYFSSGVHYSDVWHATPFLYSADTLRSPLQAGADRATAAERGDCLAEHLAFSHLGDPELPYWRERDLVAAAAGSEVPVFWSHGFLDANTKPDNVLLLWQTLAGPKRLWFGQFIHGGPGFDEDAEGRSRLEPEVLRWLDRWVADRDADTDADAPVWVQDDRGRYRSEAVWPPADATEHSWPLLTGAYVDVPGNHGARGGPYTVSGSVDTTPVPTPTGVGSWTFTQPLPHEVHLSGVARIRPRLLATAPGANLIALLYDVAPDGKARLITRGGMRLGLDAAPTLELYPQDWVLAEGHRVGLLLSGADDIWFDPGMTGRPVVVTGGTWTTPYLPIRRTEFDDGIVIDRFFLSPPVDRRIDVPAPVITARTAAADPPPEQRDPGS
jgi:uncharacterized protein